MALAPIRIPKTTRASEYVRSPPPPPKKTETFPIMIMNIGAKEAKQAFLNAIKTASEKKDEAYSINAEICSALSPTGTTAYIPRIWEIPTEKPNKEVIATYLKRPFKAAIIIVNFDVDSYKLEELLHLLTSKIPVYIVTTLSIKELTKTHIENLDKLTAASAKYGANLQIYPEMSEKNIAQFFRTILPKAEGLSAAAPATAMLSPIRAKGDVADFGVKKAPTDTNIAEPVSSPRASTDAASAKNPFSPTALASRTTPKLQHPPLAGARRTEDPALHITSPTAVGAPTSPTILKIPRGMDSKGTIAATLAAARKERDATIFSPRADATITARTYELTPYKKS